MKHFIKIIMIFILLLGVANLFSQTTPAEIGTEKEFNPELRTSSGKLRADSLNCELAGGWFSGMCYAVFTVDTLAYIGKGVYLQILNVSDPANPTSLGEISCPGVVENICVVGDLAYVADGDAGLRIIDVTDPTDPDEIGFYDTEGSANGVHIVGDLAYVADGDAGLRIIDVTDPTDPDEVGFYDTGGSAQDVHVVGNFAYVTDSSYGLLVINVSDSTDPDESGSTGGYNSYGFHVVDNLAYVACYSVGLRIINVFYSASPSEIGFCDTGGSAMDVYVVGDLAYVADGDAGLRIIDVTDPTDPDEVGFYDIEAYARGVHVVGDLAYVAYGEDGLYIIRYTGGSGIEEEIKPNVFSISQPSPNPFARETVLKYELPKSTEVDITVHNMLGQKIRELYSGEKSAGVHQLTWDGTDNAGEKLPGGIYFLRVKAGSREINSKLLLVK